MTDRPPRLSEVPEVLRGVEGIVFDKDGTLTDIDARWGAYFAAVIAAVADGDSGLHRAFADGLGLDGERIVPGGVFSVKSAEEVWAEARRIMAEAGWDEAEVVAGADRAAAVVNQGTTVPLGDVAGAVATLSGAGFRLGLATSDDRSSAEVELEKLGIANHLTAHRHGDDAVRKPDPEVLLSIAREWSVDPASIVFVGDSAQDQATARAAGCRFIAVGPDLPDADAWIATVDELVTAIGE